MGRPKGIKNKPEQPVLLSDDEKIVFLADLLVEIVMSEIIQKQETAT
jgi:hypothetical protein